MSSERQEKFVVKEFDRAAKGYDESRIVKSFQRRAQIQVISKMRLEKGMRVLDLGCGTGWGTIDIASELRGTGQVIGLDLSEKMIEQAKERLKTCKYDNVQFEVGSGSTLDYESCFDYVLSTNALHHFYNKEEIFSRVWRSLKSNGKFIIQDICDDYLLMKIMDLLGKIGEKAHVGSTTSGGLFKLLHSTGFRGIEVERIELNWFWKIMIGRGIKIDGGQI